MIRINVSNLFLRIIQNLAGQHDMAAKSNVCAIGFRICQKKSQYKSVKRYSEVVISVCMRIHLGVTATQKDDRFRIIVFTALKVNIGLEPYTQTFPESNATNANFTRTNNTQSLAGANLYEMETVDFLNALLFGWEKSYVLCKNNSVRKIVNDGLSKTPARALPYWTVWMDEPSPFVVSRVAKYYCQWVSADKLITRPQF